MPISKKAAFEDIFSKGLCVVRNFQINTRLQLLLNFSLTVSISMTFACSESSSFSGKAKTKTDHDSPAIPDETGSGGEANSGIQEFIFKGEHSTVDYLFVFDNSVSAKNILLKAGQAFQDIVQTNPNVFASDGKVAVMSTMISDDTYKSTHAQIKKYDGIDKEPGFLDFVNKESLDRFREANQKVADKIYTKGMCEEKWFSPQSKVKSDGVETETSCLQAALQSVASGVGAEAGAQAFQQILLKNKSQQIFRKEAILNVIFLSDTHDPGKPNMKSPSFNANDLRNLAMESNQLIDVKFHALAPEKGVSSEKLYNKYYFTLVEQTDGQKLHVGDFDNYSSFMESMLLKAKESKVAKIPLNKLDAPIKSVKADGNEVNYNSCIDGFICVDFQDTNIPSSGIKITIEYENL